MDEMLEEVSFSASNYTGFGLVCQWERLIPRTGDYDSKSIERSGKEKGTASNWMVLLAFLL
jgi:hypothetical protein